MTLHIGFTGTQQGMTGAQKVSFETLIYNLTGPCPDFTFNHGDCVGADAQAHNIVYEIFGCRVYIHPPIDNKKRAWSKGAAHTNPPVEYLQRNRNIVNASEILIATPNGFKEERRSGTWATIRYAKRLRKRIFIIYPDGYIEEFDLREF